jgi:ferritin-like metal-binding protein YciE
MTRSKINKSKSAASAKKRTIRRNNPSTSRRGKQITSKQKLTLYLNEALAIENAAVQRLQSRIKHTKIEDAKQRLQLHLEETRGQQDRLKQLILDLGEKGVTKDKAQLPITTPPKSLAKTVEKMLTPAELELKAAKEDAIIENAEIILYDMLTQLAVKMNAADAIPILTQILSEERSMADWIRINTPVMVAQLWPEIEASVVMNEE